MSRTLAAFILACSLASIALADPTTKPTIVYADNTTPSSPLSRSFDGVSWTPPVAGSSAAGSIAWQAIANCPIRDELSLLSLNQSNGLYLQVWDGTWWGGSTQLAADCGVHTTRVFAAEYEQLSGELLTAYRKAGGTSVYFRTYSSGSPAEQTFAMALDAAPTYISLTPKPRSDELVLLVATNTRLYAAVWNGTAWGNQVTLESTLSGLGRPYGCAYMSQAGHAMAIWGGTTGNPKYRVWDGTSWHAVSSVPAVGGELRWLSVAGNPRASNNQIMIGCINSAREVSVNTWDGASWAANLVVEATAATSIEGRVDVSYQPDGINGLVVWQRVNDHAVRYRTWNGAAWSGLQVGPNLGTEPRHIQLACGNALGEIVMLVHRRAAVLTLPDYTLYSQNGLVNENTTVVEGLVGEQASLALPAPPTNPAGATSLNYANNSTATIAPGAYAALNVGHNCTLNFSAGTYVFTTFSSNVNSLRMNFDTAGGDIDFIVTSGNVNVKNTLNVVTTGNGQLRFHILNGNFDAEQGTRMSFGTLYVYNGLITLGNNINVTGSIFASGNISIGSGAVVEPATVVGAPGRVTAMLWNNATPGSVTEVCGAIPGSGRWECFALSSATPLTPLKISRWREVSQEE